MASLEEIRSVAREAARLTLAPTEVLDVEVGDTTGADGDPVVRIRILVPNGEFDEIDGQRLVKTLMGIKVELAKTGEDRRSIVTYATPAEQANRGSPES